MKPLLYRKSYVFLHIPTGLYIEHHTREYDDGSYSLSNTPTKYSCWSLVFDYYTNRHLNEILNHDIHHAERTSFIAITYGVFKFDKSEFVAVPCEDI